MIQVGRVGMVPVNSIIVEEDRAREVMGDLDELEASLKESGLISPLAVKDNKNGTYTLLAGERRFTVIQRNNIPEIPARIYDEDLSDLEMKIIEKSENFFRKEMEYYEMDRLTIEIHRMKQELYGTAAPGPGQVGWKVSDTGDMLGVTKGTISQAIKRAEIREACPEVFDGCKTAADALKVIKKLDEAVIRQAIAKQVEVKNENGTAPSALVNLSKSYIIKNCFEGIKEIPDGVFHLVEIDPPYAINLMNQKRSEGESQYMTADYNEIPSNVYMNGDPNGSWKGMRLLLKECYRVMTDHSWLLCWFGPEPWFEPMYQAIIEAGFETTRMCPLWVKPSGQTKQPETRLPNAYEMFFYAWKGRPAIARQRGTNTFIYSPVPAQQKVHPTERPLEMMRDIYETFAFPGSRVLIPCAGSGSGIIAAHQSGMTAIGFDLSKSYRDSFLVKVHGMV